MTPHSEEQYIALLKKADAVSARRFSTISTEHAPMAVLQDIAKARLAQRLLANEEISGTQHHLPDDNTFLHTKLAKQPLGPLEVVQQRVKLPSLPSVVIELQQAVQDSATSSEQLAEIIAMDPKLTIAILTLVNSALFNLPGKISSIPRAVTIIGAHQISVLALSSSILGMFQDTKPDVIDLELFWKHSISCAILALDLAKRSNQKNPEDFFVAGLLHDLGRIPLFSADPKLAKIAIALENSKGIPLHVAEKKVFDFDHCMLGAMFFKQWGLPNTLCAATLHHHSPNDCLEHSTATVVHVANIISLALGYGSAHENFVEPMGKQAWESLNISPSSLWDISEGLDEKIEEISKILLK